MSENVFSDIDNKAKEEIQEPRQWVVHIKNDDYTPIEFVIALLTKIFNKSIGQARQLAGEAHEKGEAVVGKYTKDIAETKVQISLHNAKMRQYPFLIACDPEQ